MARMVRRELEAHLAEAGVVVARRTGMGRPPGVPTAGAEVAVGVQGWQEPASQTAMAR